MHLRNIPAIVMGIISLFSVGAQGIEVRGTLRGEHHWSSALSPVIVVETVVIEEGANLHIDPGVNILFLPSAGLIVRGRLSAVGSPTDSIRFLPQFPDSGWGGIGFLGEVPPEVEIPEGKSGITGSELAYVHMMGARSGHPKIDAPLTIQFASPEIRNSSFTDLEGNVGSVRIVLGSAPQFKECLFQHNRANQGGAIAISTGARPLFEHCQFIDNRADVQGGAVYVMLADAQFIGCLFLRNSSRNLGGALSGIRVGELTIERSAWIENSAQVRGHNIFLSEQVNVVITQCLFSQLRDALYLQQAKGSIEAQENWWGDFPSRIRLTDLIYDGRVNPQEPVVKVSGLSWAPPPDNPYIPQSVNAVQLCKDDQFTDPIPNGVAIGAKLRIRAEAMGLFSDRVEVIPIKVLTSSRDEGIVVPLWETDPKSNIFIGTATIGTSQDQSGYRIKGSDGEEILIRHPLKLQPSAVYPILPARPLILSLTLMPQQDLTHFTSYEPTLQWEYYDILEARQKAFKIRLWQVKRSEKGFERMERQMEDLIWESGVISSSQPFFTYTGGHLKEGKTYLWEVEVSNGRFWSEPQTLSMRMNSRPSPPQIRFPSPYDVLSSLTIDLEIESGVDTEGDSVWCDLELKEVPGDKVVWQLNRFYPPRPLFVVTTSPLSENGIYHLRGRSYDGFEEGSWSPYTELAINTIPEPPSKFEVVTPQMGDTLYDLQPTIHWSKSFDPDPYDVVTYGLEVYLDPEGRRLVHRGEEIIEAEYILPVKLSNRTDYFLKVWAVDKTGRKTEALPAVRFFTETTPSIPQPLFPTDESEVQPDGIFTWNRATDPDPRDRLTYHLQVSLEGAFRNIIAHAENIEATSIPLKSLSGWESLKDNTIYYWRVSAIDPHNAQSDWSLGQPFFYNLVNDPPSLPKWSAMPDTITGTTQMNFQWEAAEDPDRSDPPSSLIYEVEICSQPEFSSNTVITITSPPGATKLSHKLGDNAIWYYRLRAKDRKGAVSPWTSPRWVLVNTQPDPPNRFHLLNPSDGSEIVFLDSVLFSWEPAIDPDPGDILHYRLELSLPDGGKETITTEKTQFLWTKPLPNEAVITWKVVARDREGLETECLNAFRFRTRSTPSTPQPQTFTLKTVGAENLLEWHPAYDPDYRDRVRYEIEVAEDSLFSQVLITLSDLEQNQVAIRNLPRYENLPENRRVWWRVRAYDQRKAYSGWSQSAAVTINFINEPPQPFDLLSPQNGDTTSPSGITLKWTPSHDPDPDTRITYHLQLSRDPQFNEVLLNLRNLLKESFIIPEGVVEPGGIYYWKVVAEDGQGGSTPAIGSELPWRFIVKNP